MLHIAVILVNLLPIVVILRSLFTDSSDGDFSFMDSSGPGQYLTDSCSDPGQFVTDSSDSGGDE